MIRIEPFDWAVRLTLVAALMVQLAAPALCGRDHGRGHERPLRGSRGVDLCVLRSRRGCREGASCVTVSPPRERAVVCLPAVECHGRDRDHRLPGEREADHLGVHEGLPGRVAGGGLLFRSRSGSAGGWTGGISPLVFIGGGIAVIGGIVAIVLAGGGDDGPPPPPTDTGFPPPPGRP